MTPRRIWGSTHPIRQRRRSRWASCFILMRVRHRLTLCIFTITGRLFHSHTAAPISVLESVSDFAEIRQRLGRGAAISSPIPRSSPQSKRSYCRSPCTIIFPVVGATRIAGVFSATTEQKEALCEAKSCNG